MPTLTKTFTITNTTLPYTAEGGSWAATVGVNSVASTVTTPSPPGGTDAFQTATSGKNHSDTNIWKWSGAWTALGVPAGAIVQTVQVTREWECSTATTILSSSVGGTSDGLYDGSGVLLVANANASTTYSTTTSYANYVGSTLTVPAGSAGAVTSIQLWLNATQATGNSSSANNTLLQGTIAVTVAYLLPFTFWQWPVAQPYPQPAVTMASSNAGLPSGASSSGAALAITLTLTASGVLSSPVTPVTQWDQSPAAQGFPPSGPLPSIVPAGLTTPAPLSPPGSRPAGAYPAAPSWDQSPAAQGFPPSGPLPSPALQPAPPITMSGSLALGSLGLASPVPIPLAVWQQPQQGIPGVVWPGGEGL